jgi:hypothetical protein
MSLEEGGVVMVEAAPPQPCTEGWMEKKGERHWDGWKRRFFRIENGGRTLKYYANPGEHPKGEIDLVLSDSVRSCHSSRELEIVCATRTYRLRCHSVEEVATWKKGIAMAVRDLPPVEMERSGSAPRPCAAEATGAAGPAAAAGTAGASASPAAAAFVGGAEEAAVDELELGPFVKALARGGSSRRITMQGQLRINFGITADDVRQPGAEEGYAFKSASHTTYECQLQGSILSFNPRRRARESLHGHVWRVERGPLLGGVGCIILETRAMGGGHEHDFILAAPDESAARNWLLALAAAVGEAEDGALRNSKHAEPVPPKNPLHVLGDPATLLGSGIRTDAPVNRPWLETVSLVLDVLSYGGGGGLAQYASWGGDHAKVGVKLRVVGSRQQTCCRCTEYQGIAPAQHIDAGRSSLGQAGGGDTAPRLGASFAIMLTVNSRWSQLELVLCNKAGVTIGTLRLHVSELRRNGGEHHHDFHLEKYKAIESHSVERCEAKLRELEEMVRRDVFLLVVLRVAPCMPAR